MTPFVTVDIETTGIPNKPPGWEPRVVEVGAVAVTAEGRLADTFELLVWQPPEHLWDDRARGAMLLSDITSDEILEYGWNEQVAAVRFATWLGRMQERHGVSLVRAFNQTFDFGFLSAPPWRLYCVDGLMSGDCIMLASHKLMDAANALPRWPSGESKWPKAEEAAEFFRKRGHPIERQGRAHRALSDARVEAQIAVAIERERQKEHA